MADGSVGTESKSGNARTVADLNQPDRDLEVAASFIESAMGRILVCVAALKNENADADTRLAIASMLGDETHNDLDVAREMFQAWKAHEVAHARN